MGTYEEFRANRRRAVAVGATLTMVLVPAFFVLPFFLPVKGFKRLYFDLTGEWLWGNPFNTLRWFAGPIAGTVTGYLTEGGWGRRAATAVTAIGYGIGGVYCLAVLYTVGKGVLVWQSFPLFQLVINPLILVLPVGLVSILGGFLGGLAGHVLRVHLRWDEQSP